MDGATGAGDDLITEAEINRVKQQRQLKEQLKAEWDKQQSRELVEHELSSGALHVVGEDPVNASTPQFDPYSSDTWNMRVKVSHSCTCLPVVAVIDMVGQ